MIKRYKYTLILSLIIMYLSLKNAEEFNKVQFLNNIPHFDKFVHFCMYFALMSVAVFESHKSARKSPSIFLLALYPFLYGVIMEILQIALTTTRGASIFDVIFNTIGIFISVLIWMFILRGFRKKLNSNNI